MTDVTVDQKRVKQAVTNLVKARELVAEVDREPLDALVHDIKCLYDDETQKSDPRSPRDVQAELLNTDKSWPRVESVLGSIEKSGHRGKTLAKEILGDLTVSATILPPDNGNVARLNRERGMHGWL